MIKVKPPEWGGFADINLLNFLFAHLTMTLSLWLELISVRKSSSKLDCSLT